MRASIALLLIVVACRTESATPHTVAGPARSASPCEGVRVDIAAAVTDARCVFYDEEKATTLRDTYEQRATEVKARAAPLAGGQVEVTVDNPSDAPLVVPFFLSQVVDLYPVIARSGGKQVRLRASPAITSGTARWERARNFARIEVAPHGSAFVILQIDPIIVEERPDCAPNEKCAPTRVERGGLPAGKWELAIELPVYAATRPTAKVSWSPP